MDMQQFEMILGLLKDSGEAAWTFGLFWLGATALPRVLLFLFGVLVVLVLRTLLTKTVAACAANTRTCGDLNDAVVIIGGMTIDAPTSYWTNEERERFFERLRQLRSLEDN